MLPTFHFTIERWKWNEEYQSYVSTEGRVKTKEKQLKKILVDDCGYTRVRCGDKKVSVHRLVMLTFRPISNPDEMTVDHLNHNKRDCRLKNLEWVTNEENLRRATEDFVGNCNQKKKITIKQECPIVAKFWMCVPKVGRLPMDVEHAAKYLNIHCKNANGIELPEIQRTVEKRVRNRKHSVFGMQLLYEVN